VSGPTTAVAVLTIVPADAGVATAVTVNVTLPPDATSTLVEMSPVPEATHDEPGVAEQVHAGLPSPAGYVSSTVTPLAASGPEFATATV
jgi:hypothetical protein